MLSKRIRSRVFYSYANYTLLHRTVSGRLRTNLVHSRTVGSWCCSNSLRSRTDLLRRRTVWLRSRTNSPRCLTNELRSCTVWPRYRGEYLRWRTVWPWISASSADSTGKVLICQDWNSPPFCFACLIISFSPDTGQKRSTTNSKLCRTITLIIQNSYFTEWSRSFNFYHNTIRKP